MKNTKAETHEGNVVSVDGDKFTSKCTDGKMLHHILATGATVTCDGKDCKSCRFEARNQSSRHYAKR